MSCIGSNGFSGGTLSLPDFRLKQEVLQGWQVEYNIPVLNWGDVDAFVRSPNGNCFTIDTKSHGKTVFFNGTRLMQRYGQRVFSFQNKDLLKAVREQAAEIQKIKGIRYVIPMICFTNAELDIGTVDNLIEGVYVVKHESLIMGL
ncbi:NERD domain-containing protein [Chroococcidiopsis sp. SAG 2025]|uniref:NERD domain-containing protein n=1 Tax=Chroococcidiopsis sp. SAG 2025 TaxID=171389 RepID=UPI002936ECB0|nr:NERD domain-containing protein [Chroococcidiopsis sp. SAG 2025]